MTTRALDGLNEDFRDVLLALVAEDVESVIVGTVSFIGRDALRRNKRAAGRAKDLADLESLGRG
jgi:hypothetical protein